MAVISGHSVDYGFLHKGSGLEIAPRPAAGGSLYENMSCII